MTDQALILRLVQGDVWEIMEPSYHYGRQLGGGLEDRRYQTVCTVKGSLDLATSRLHQLERGRPPLDPVVLDEEEDGLPSESAVSELHEDHGAMP